MPADQPADNEQSGSGAHANRLDAQAGAGDVVQARDVHGGIHFHHDHQPPFTVTPRQLPGHVQGFVNRHAELAQLAEVVADGGEASPPLVIITGTAGVGKTSLALRWAHGIRHHFPDGQLYANLHGYDPGPPATAEQVLDRFLRDLGVPARAIPSTVDDRSSLYRSVLADARVLVVLDNAAMIGQVRPLLPGTPGSLVVVTSRSRLSGLVAREGAYRLRLDLLDDDDAVALLRAVTAGYRAGDTHDDLVELAGLCARLPLALRIAAERAASHPMMPLGELIADLRDESELWDALTADGEQEADAVRTVFAWSYRALPQPAARTFRLLGLHPGGEFGVPAVAALAGTHITQARHDLDALAGAHLVEHSGPGRYQFHDLLRAYATDQVRDAEDEPARSDAVRRVLAFYLHTADAAQQVISPYDRDRLTDPVPPGITALTFDGYEQALRWYQTEAANLVDATRTAAAGGEHATAWKLAAVLGAIYMHQNAFEDWIATSRIGAASAAMLGDRTGEAASLDSLGKAYFQSLRLDEAESCHRRALALRRDLGDRFGEAISINALGLLGLRRRHLQDAAAHFRDGTRIVTELGERRFTAILGSNLAEVMCERGEYLDAVRLIREALSALRGLGDRSGEGNALFLLAWAYRGAGLLHDASAAITGALAIAEENDNDVWRAHWLTEQGRIQLARKQPDDALTSLQRAAVIHRRLGDRSREAITLDVTGQAYQQRDRYDEAAMFHRRAASMHRELHDRWHQATSLDHLATALDRNGDPDHAQTHRREALALLREFDDPPAAAMRQRLTQVLST